MIRYRIKTEKEFLKDFGEHWRKIVQFKFPIEMDILLGVDITKEIITNGAYSNFFDKGGNFKDSKQSLKVEIRGSSYIRAIISRDMLIPTKLKPTYTTKKIIHD